MPLQGLILKQDTSEIVRDVLANILATETASQQALAAAAGETPDDWKLRVFTERSNPWEVWLNDDEDKSPLVNVWYDGSTFSKGAGNTVSRQTAEGTFNLDCYGYGVSRDDGEGHIPGDRDAALEVQRALRLVRNILMASEYTYLGLRGTVGQRWPQSINVFQPPQETHSVQQIVGARLSLGVSFNEYSPQFEGCPLEGVSITLLRSETGEVLAESEYDYTED